MSPDIVAEFVNTFGAFGLALVVFGCVAYGIWAKFLHPSIEAKNEVQTQYVNSMKELMDNHREESSANLEAQVKTTEVLTALSERIRVGNARMIDDHNRILDSVERKQGG